MLQIYVYGPHENGFLELAAETGLTMEQLQPQFDEDLSTGEFSIPFEIPWTDHNRKLMGYPERVVNFNFGKNYFMCDVYDRGVPEMQKAKLTLLGKQGRWTYDSGAWQASVSGTKGLFGAAIKNKSLKDIFYGNPIIWEGMDSRAFAKQTVTDNTSGNGQYPYLRFPPVGIENFIDKERSDYSNEFLAQDTANNIVANASTGQWWYGTPKPLNDKEPTTSADVTYINHRTIPMLTVPFITRKIFEHFGYQVKGDWIDDPAFANLTLFNNYAIEAYNVTARQDSNRSIILRNHVPDRMVTVFLKSLFGFFGLYMTFSDSYNVQLIYYKTMLRSRKIAKLDDYIINLFEASYEDGQSQQGYKLAYAWDETEGYHGDRIKDPASSQVVANVNNYSELETLNIGRPLTTDDLVFVRKENLFYKLANATTTPKRWDCWGERLSDYVEGEGDASFDYGINPLPVYVSSNPTTGVIERKNYVGTRLKGSYLNNKGIRVLNAYGLFIFYSAVVTINGTLKHPASFTMPWYKSNDGDSLADRGAQYSLAWQGADAMALTFHAEWRNVTRNKETIKVTLEASRKLEYLLRTHNHFEINGVLFLLKQINKEVPLGRTLQALLVAADTEGSNVSNNGLETIEGSTGQTPPTLECTAVINLIEFMKLSDGSVRISWTVSSGTPGKFIVQSPYRTETVNRSPTVHYLNEGDDVVVTPICIFPEGDISGTGAHLIYVEAEAQPV